MLKIKNTILINFPITETFQLYCKQIQCIYTHKTQSSRVQDFMNNLSDRARYVHTHTHTICLRKKLQILES